MEMEITLPEEVPVMTLAQATLFPQALMPLHIFEPRYRAMLRDVLAGDRLFAVVGLDERRAEAGDFEPPHRVAAVGIVRACQRNPDGTSNLLLQGLCRAEVLAISQDEPYRRIQIRALASEAGATPEANEALRRELSRLIGVKLRLAGKGEGEMASFLKTVDDPEAFVDIAAASLCDDADLRQRLLEILDVNRRLSLLGSILRREIEALRLRRRLQGNLPDDRIEQN